MDRFTARGVAFCKTRRKISLILLPEFIGICPTG